ncbi:MAG: transcriptional regulator, TetR family [Firmicutes bacterium]|nr:transcriptional regulator, TetR family [Bacillota bacterium]
MKEVFHIPATFDLPSRELRERLILAGIQELSAHGIQDFSVRRVATACGVSNAAPYKHFEDKTSFIAAIVSYVNKQWEACIPDVVQKYPDNLQKQLTEISVRYVHFLVENSHFRSILMLKDPTFDMHFSDLRHSLSATSQKLVAEYCNQVGMPPEVTAFKLYVVRSLIYGAALMFDNGEMTYNEENIDYVRQAISREFTLP